MILLTQPCEMHRLFEMAFTYKFSKLYSHILIDLLKKLLKTKKK